MSGKRGLIMGVANDHSIAWGIAKTLSQFGAEIALTYQGETLKKRVAPLAESLGSNLILPCDVEDDASLDETFSGLRDAWGGLDFVVHAIAYADKSELEGAYINTTSQNFDRTVAVSCYSFTKVAQRAEALMLDGGSLLTLTFIGADRVIPNYNVMGVAKAALEASVQYLAADLGPKGIRVNAISAGPVRTLAGSAIKGAREILNWSARHAPLRQNAGLGDLGAAALYLLSDFSSGVTGEIHFVDSGYGIVAIPQPPKSG